MTFCDFIVGEPAAPETRVAETPAAETPVVPEPKDEAPPATQFTEVAANSTLNMNTSPQQQRQQPAVAPAAPPASAQPVHYNMQDSLPSQVSFA